MGDHTGISWTEATWNPVRGCSRRSEGCRRCYAETIAARFSGPGQAYEGLADRARPGSKWTGVVKTIPHMLDQPLRWRSPRTIFINSMSDLFHENLSDDDVDAVFGIMALAHWHTFQVLTKRSDRMRQWAEERQKRRAAAAECVAEAYYAAEMLSNRWPFDTDRALGLNDRGWPLPNVWMGVSVENQPAADERIPDLRNTPAAKRFVSAEPLIGPVTAELDGIDWLIIGGESGAGAREMQPSWATSLIDQCRAAGVAPYFKQTGSNLGPWPIGLVGKGDDHEVWPPEFCVQEMPI